MKAIQSNLKVIAYVSDAIITRFIWNIAKNTSMTEEQALKLLILSKDVYTVMEASKLADKGFCYDAIYQVVCRGLTLTERHCELFNGTKTGEINVINTKLKLAEALSKVLNEFKTNKIRLGKFKKRAGLIFDTYHWNEKHGI